MQLPPQESSLQSVEVKTISTTIENSSNYKSTTQKQLMQLRNQFPDALTAPKIEIATKVNSFNYGDTTIEFNSEVLKDQEEIPEYIELIKNNPKLAGFGVTVSNGVHMTLSGKPSYTIKLEYHRPDLSKYEKAEVSDVINDILSSSRKGFRF